MPRASNTSLEIEGHLYHQVPQYSKTVDDLKLYLNLICKFNNAHTMKRAKKQAAIKEDINYVLEELWGLIP